MQINNFGCFEKSNKVIFNKEDILIGPNNSGKSMLFNSLNLFRWYIITGGVPWNTKDFNLTSYKDIVYNHEEHRDISINIQINNINYRMIIYASGSVSLSQDNHQIKRESIDKEVIKSIWYIKPNRVLIPYYSSLQITDHPLQPIDSNGSNISYFLLDKYTDQDDKWEIAKSWFTKIDPRIEKIKTKITGSNLMFETNYSGNISFNLSLQGSGTQNVLSIIATLIFSPNNSTIIIEEPEICLHSRSQEVVVDLINDVVNRENKQVIFSTHSWDMILPLISDMEIGSPRGKDHIIANPDYLKIHTFTPKNGNIPIEEYDFKGKKYIDIRNNFKTLWG